MGDMNREGHAGLTLIIMSLLFSLIDLWDRHWLVILFLTVGFSMLPDIDIRFEIPHRKFTHNIIFAFLSGLGTGILFEYSGMDFWMGFTGAFAGSVLHITGDLLTIMPFAPLSPFIRKKFAIGLFRADNTVVNRVFLLAGVMVFLSLYPDSPINLHAFL